MVTTLKGACECGVFEKVNISAGDKAIIQQTPLNVTCDFEGNEVCQSMCSALAEAARAKGPTLLCASILNVNDLKVCYFLLYILQLYYNVFNCRCPCLRAHVLKKTGCTLI